MTKPTISLQDLRRRIYIKAKAEPAWRFWGLYVHVCKMEILHMAYDLARQNNGAPGIDGVTFEAIEQAGGEGYLQQIRQELVNLTYHPTRNRKKGIPKDNGKSRILGIPTIKDRVVQGALKLILEPIFEADFQSGSYGYCPRRIAHEAIDRVAKAIVYHKTRVIDIDLSAYFDNVRHHILLEKVAKRVNDNDIMRLLKLILKASGKKGVPQGGVISPLLSNVYLNEVDKMLERAKEVTRDRYTHLEYARFADDLVVLVDEYERHDWIVKAVNKQLREEFTKLHVQVNVVVDDYKYYMATLNNSSEVRLTTRECQVVQLLTEGKSTKQIALCLHVSPKTVDSNRREVMNKLGIFSVAELTKYARGHVYVNVSLENRHDQSYIRFDIEDTGMGIAQERQLEIFESFNQVDGSICRKYGGTGLGLAITRQLAEFIRGELTLTSEEGKGSVFSCVIPAGLDSTTQPLLDTSEPADNVGIT